MLYPKHPSFQQPPAPPGPAEGNHAKHLRLRMILIAAVALFVIPFIIRPLQSWWDKPAQPPRWEIPAPPQIVYVPAPQPVQPPTPLTDILPKFAFSRPQQETHSYVAPTVQGSVPSPTVIVQDCNRQAVDHDVHLINPNWMDMELPANHGKTAHFPSNDMRMFVCGPDFVTHSIYRSGMDCALGTNTCMDASGNVLDIKPHDGTSEDPIVEYYLENTSANAHKVSVTYQPKI